MTDNNARILVVEDDPNILLGLREVLGSEGYETHVCDDGDKAFEAVRTHSPDLIILDIMLPGKSGYDICKGVRAGGYRMPILMLTAKGQELDKVIGLDLGADDYVTKPFGLKELLARIKALLRRSRTEADPASASAPFRVGECEIDPKAFQLRRDGKVEDLTERELRLLQFFHSHAGEVLSRDKLLEGVWGYNYYGTTRTLDQVIVQLRRKLGDSGNHPRHLLTVHGVGYKLAR